MGEHSRGIPVLLSRRLPLLLGFSAAAVLGFGLATSTGGAPAGDESSARAIAAVHPRPPANPVLRAESSRHAAQAVAAARLIVVSPQPGTPDASPRTQISFLGVPANQLGTVTVRGSRTGRHAGRLRSYAAAPGASFIPDKSFAPGETVNVRLRPSPAGLTTALSFSFSVARPGAQARLPRGRLPAIVKSAKSSTSSLPATEHYLSRPALHPPTVAITHHDAGASSGGDIFVAPLGSGGARIAQRGPMILDPQGHVVWFYPLPRHQGAENFMSQTYDGRPALTWWQGHINPLGFGQGQDVIADRSYHIIERIKGGNGEPPDLHEFLLTPQGTAWVDSYVPVRADLRAEGGPQDGSLLDSIVQEIDLKTGLVMFEWHPLGHIALSDSYSHVLTGQTWDPYHINSIDVHGDHLIVSARNTWAVYEVSLLAGNINWRVGGKRSSFHLGQGARFAYQHDAHLHADGTLTMFDDQAAPQVGPQSRGLVLKLEGHEAKLVHAFTHSGSVIAGSQGSMQTLPNGDVMIGWGSEPYFSEYTADGHLVYDGHFPRPIQTYRAYRFDWQGLPPTQPALVTTRAHGKVTAHASWNGAASVARWQLLAGPDGDHLSAIEEVKRTGFETLIPVRTNQAFIAARALDAHGQALGTSIAVPA